MHFNQFFSVRLSRACTYDRVWKYAALFLFLLFFSFFLLNIASPLSILLSGSAVEIDIIYFCPWSAESDIPCLSCPSNVAMIMALSALFLREDLGYSSRPPYKSRHHLLKLSLLKCNYVWASSLLLAQSQEWPVVKVSGAVRTEETSGSVYSLEFCLFTVKDRHFLVLWGLSPRRVLANVPTYSDLV